LKIDLQKIGVQKRVGNLIDSCNSSCVVRMDAESGMLIVAVKRELVVMLIHTFIFSELYMGSHFYCGIPLIFISVSKLESSFLVILCFS
jgi:hypothetical protein